MVTRQRLLSGIMTTGWAIALYLTWVHYQPAVLMCPATGVWHCARVLHSAGSAIGPVPLATLGGLWLLLWRQPRSRWWNTAGFLLAALGLGWAEL
jgi:uncharacterized membrane protein